LTWRANEYSQ